MVLRPCDLNPGGIRSYWSRLEECHGFWDKGLFEYKIHDPSMRQLYI